MIKHSLFRPPATSPRLLRPAVFGVLWAQLLGLGCGGGEEAGGTPRPGAAASAGANPVPAVVPVASQLIIDKTNSPGPTSGFYWIPPVVQTASSLFTSLDSTGGANGLTVRIDRLYADNSTDATAKATFTGSAITMVTGGSHASFPGVTGPFYGVNWTPGTGVAAGQTYRASVQALTPARLLGVVDVQVVANSGEAGTVDRTRFTPLVVGGTLRIVFRLEAKDTDGDTLNDWRDNCTVTKNVSQLDSDADGRGDACQCLNVANGTPCSTGCKIGQTCMSGVCSGGTNRTGSCTTGNPCKQNETCTAGACGGGSNRTGSCSTGNPCKQSETCSSGVCGGGSNRTGSCTTGNSCKQSETCSSGVCGGGSNKTGSCATGNPCKQSETCSSGVCGGGSNKANGTLCSDANLCTPDTCQTGVCTPGTAVACSPDTQCHNAGTCNPATGLCPTIKANGTMCSDSNACTNGDSCQSGICTGGGSVTCPPVGQCQVAGACNPATGCPVAAAKPEWTPCSLNDGNACNGLDVCRSGECRPEDPGLFITCAPTTHVTFYQSYNSGTTIVDEAALYKTPFQNGQLQLAAGLFGGGIKAETDPWIEYHTDAVVNPNNAVFSKPGSASVWIKMEPGYTYPSFFVALDSNFYFQAGEAADHFWAHTDAIRTITMPKPASWKPDGKWHLVVVNWSLDGITMNVDGVSSAKSPSWTGPLPAGPVVNSWVVAGGSATGGYRDEVLYLDRPLTQDEIDWYYAQRDTVSTTNPAVAHFRDTPGCNRGEDLNPCTTDSCDPTSGVQHGNITGECCHTPGPGPVAVPKDDWTPCGNDNNVCNGMEVCRSAVCKPEQPGAGTTCAGGPRVTFYQSFDNGPAADIAASSAIPGGTTPLLKAPGLFGSALDQSATNELLYRTADPGANPANIVLSKPGSVSLWMKPPAGYDANSVLFMTFSAGAQLFVADYPDGVKATLDRSWDVPGFVQAQSNGPPNWRNEQRWHLIVVNWSQRGLEVSVDGVWSPVQRAPWMQSFDFWPGGENYLYAGPYWNGAGNGTHKDELLVLNRPMTHEEVAWYYQQRGLGPNVPNPAIAHFQNDATVCNPADDLDPCTTDSCVPGSGHLNTPASNVTCDDRNACTANDLCQSGTCAGAPVNPDDGNVCTADSCDPVVGLVHSAGNEGQTCSDGNPYTSVDVCIGGGCRGSNPGLPVVPVYAELVDLGALNGGVGVDATAIGNGGDIGGYENPSFPRPWRKSRTGAMQEIVFPAGGVGYVKSINAGGVVVGQMSPALDWTVGTFGYSAVGQQVIVRPTAQVWLEGINAANVIVGYHAPPGSTYRAIRIDGGINGTLTELPDLAIAPGYQTYAMGIGPEGEIVGYGNIPEPASPPVTPNLVSGWGWMHAFRRMPNDTGSLQDLNDLIPPGSSWQILYRALATNGSQTVGWGVSNNRMRAFRHDAATGELLDLGAIDDTKPGADEGWNTVSGRFSFYEPHAINRDGDVVGHPYYGGAFYYSEARHQMFDLQDYVDPAWKASLDRVWGINDDGEIVGTMGIQGDPKAHAFKMKLPASMQNPYPKVKASVAGMVDVGDGEYAVVFNYKSDEPAEVDLLPGETSNRVYVNDVHEANPVPAPPTRFATGFRAGAFLPKGRVGDRITWVLAGRAASLQITPSTVQPLPDVVDGPDIGVNVPDGNGGVILVIVKGEICSVHPNPCMGPATRDPVAGTCTYAALPDGAGCTDGNACTQTDTCQAGVCTGSSFVVCSGSSGGGQCQTASVCNPATGMCQNLPVPDGFACNDGNRCTQTDSCRGGVCVGENPVVCATSDQCHAAGTCDPDTGQCSKPALADNTPCDDGSACTQTDTCVAGSCTGGSSSCALAEAPPQQAAEMVLLEEDIGLNMGPNDSRFPTGISSDGTVVGYTEAPDGKTWAWRYSPSGQASPVDALLSMGSRGHGINDAGTVVGEISGIGNPIGKHYYGPPNTLLTDFFWTSHPFRWQLVPDLMQAITGYYGRAVSINNAGQSAVVLYELNGTSHAVFADSAFGELAGSSIGVPTPPGPRFTGNTLAFGISPANAGPFLVGSAETFDEREVALDGNLPPAPTSMTFRMHEAIVFHPSENPTLSHPGDLTILKDIPAGIPIGTDFRLFAATATNGRDVVGWGSFEEGGYWVCRAFKWTPLPGASPFAPSVPGAPDLSFSHQKASLVFLGTIPDLGNGRCAGTIFGGYHPYVADAINSRGEIVGSVRRSQSLPGGAFFYSPSTGMMDLNRRIDPSKGITLRTATGINDQGQIVGTYTTATDTRVHAYRLTLPPNFTNGPLAQFDWAMKSHLPGIDRQLPEVPRTGICAGGVGYMCLTSQGLPGCFVAPYDPSSSPPPDQTCIEASCLTGWKTFCRTSCGSIGIETCGSDGTWGSCQPPFETCDGSDENCDGQVDEDHVCTNPHSSVDPSKRGFDVTLDAALSWSAQSPIVKCTWDIPGVLDGPIEGCKVDVVFPREDDFPVTLTVTTANQKHAPETHKVSIRNIIIASIGDSIASGEGSPDVPGIKATTDDQGHVIDPGRLPTWLNRRCHRSLWSAHALTAKAIEDADPRTSVTFISRACSGAGIDRGLLGAYGGSERLLSEVSDLNPQILELRALVGEEKADAILLQIGANDARFSDVIAKCGALGPAGPKLHPFDCDDLKDVALPTALSLRNSSGYPRVAAALGGLTTGSSRIYISDYPQPFQLPYNELTSWCPTVILRMAASDQTGPWFDAFQVFTGGTVVSDHGYLVYDDIVWASATFLPALNASIALNTGLSETGWTHATGVNEKFVGKAMCLPSSAFVQYDESLNNQFNYKGVFHPNREGQRIYGSKICPLVTRDLGVSSAGCPTVP